jgi:uncharacterized membrane protein YfcA
MVLPLAAAAALGVPLGVWALNSLDEDLIKRVLGVVLIAYALYGVWKPHVRPRCAPICGPTRSAFWPACWAAPSTRPVRR